MKQTKWNFWEAFKIVFKTYLDDFGAGADKRYQFMSRPNISDVQDGQITGIKAGSQDVSAQTVIFIHGSPANAMRWSGYLENVPEGYNYIAIDRMGFGVRGKSNPDLEVDYKLIRQYAAQFDKPIIVGHSLGGAIALRLATQLKLKGLVLVAASLDPSQEKTMKVQEWGRHKLVSWILSHSVRHSNEEMFQLQKFMMRTETHLDKITTSIELVHAQDDALVSQTQVDYAQKYIPHVNVTLPRRGGHAIPWTRPEIIEGAILNLSEEDQAA